METFFFLCILGVGKCCACEGGLFLFERATETLPLYPNIARSALLARYEQYSFKFQLEAVHVLESYGLHDTTERR